MRNYIVSVTVLEQKGFFSKSSYRATSCDVPDIFVTANNYNEVLNKIEEKMLQYFDLLSDRGNDIPVPKEVSSVTFQNRDENVFFHTITIDTSIYSEKTEKINVTVPIKLTKKIDEFLKNKVHNINLFSSRSDFITKACQHYLPYAQNIASIMSNENIIALRYKCGNTGENSLNLFNYLQLAECSDVILFSTFKEIDETYSQDDGPETNLPLLGAVAKINLLGVGDIFILFDGLFLTAQRKPRYNEVKMILDEAEKSQKTSFIQLAVPFTSRLQADEAVKLLWKFPKQVLNADSRSTFFRLLSSVSERQYEKY